MLASPGRPGPAAAGEASGSAATGTLTLEALHTFAPQAHPADGCAGAIVTTVVVRVSD